MAIEINPVNKNGTQRWKNIFLIVSIFIFIIVLAGFFAFKFYFIKEAEKKLAEANIIINQIGTEEQKRMEEELQKAEWQIHDFKILWENSPKVSQLFPYLESIVHPRVYFTNFSLNVAENKINLVVRADTFQSLIQQIQILENKPDFIEKFEVSNISAAEKGGVSFNLVLTVKPSIFK